MGPERTIDGSGLDDNDLHSKEPEDMWLSGSDPLGAWIEYEFDKVYKVHELWVWNSNQTIELFIGFGLKDVTVEYSTNGTDWTTLAGVPQFAQAPGTPGYEHNITIDFGGVAAKYVRLTATSNWGGIMPQYSLCEVRFLHIPVHARNPDPDSGATGVPLDVVLDWAAGREAVTHDVHFGDDRQAVIDSTAPVATVTESSYGPLPLDLGKTYYWRVDEVNEAETPTTWQGRLWDFTAQDHLVVDDIESYNDRDPGDPKSNRIFLAWVDGYDVPTNGSLVGYENPPFCEQSIVHSGMQSMPYFYDNSGPANYSEATLTLSSQRDWTEEGVKILTLWFYGDPANAAESMYVAVASSGGAPVVTRHDDPGATQTGDWTEWSIDLKQFADQGVNLTNVNTISIGFGDKTNPQPGGSGTMYFDDIRLYPPR